MNFVCGDLRLSPSQSENRFGSGHRKTSPTWDHLKVRGDQSAFHRGQIRNDVVKLMSCRISPTVITGRATEASPVRSMR